MKKLHFGGIVTGNLLGLLTYGGVFYWFTKDKIGINLLDGVTLEELKAVLSYLFWGIYQENSFWLLIPAVATYFIGGLIGEVLYGLIFSSRINRYEEEVENLLDKERINEYLEEIAREQEQYYEYQKNQSSYDDDDDDWWWNPADPVARLIWGSDDDWD